MQQSLITSIPKKTALYISIATILFYWIYIFFIKANSAPNLPSDLSAILMSIIKTKIILFLVIFFLLQLEGDNFKLIGFAGPRIFKQILTGILFGIGTWVFIHIMFNPAINTLFPKPSIQGVDMSIYMKDIKSVLLWMPVVIIGGGLVEELQRIFILTRFEKWLGKNGLYFALILSSIAFGMGHLYQGLNTAIGTGIGGLMFGLVYLRKRSATEAVSCHAFFNVLSIIGGYMSNHS